jgi:hypothetical protein
MIMVNVALDKRLQWFLNTDAHRTTIIKAVLPKMRPDFVCILNGVRFAPIDHRLRELAMRRSSVIIIIALAIVVAASGAEAKLDLYIDKSRQQISIVQNGSLLYVWPVSTGGDRFSTPSGVYAPERLERSWFSRVYYNSPMPHAIFFHHGYAIHGSYDMAQLGGPASHGCVRLHPQAAALLFAMVEQEGPGNTTIVVGASGSPNPPPPRYRDLDEPLRTPYLRDDGLARGAYPPGPKMQPYDNAHRYVDVPGPRRGDGSQLAMRGAYPTNRPSAPRLDAQASVEPTLSLRGSYRPPATATAATKSNPKCPNCSPNRVSDEPADRHVSPGETAKSPPPALPPPASSLPPSPQTEQQQPSLAYHVLPRSYWAGASWRWRLKREQETTGVPPPTPDSP